MPVITGDEHRLHYVTALLRELMSDPQHSRHLPELDEALLLIELKILEDASTDIWDRLTTTGQALAILIGRAVAKTATTIRIKWENEDGETGRVTFQSMPP